MSDEERIDALGTLAQIDKIGADAARRAGRPAAEGVALARRVVQAATETADSAYNFVAPLKPASFEPA